MYKTKIFIITLTAIINHMYTSSIQPNTPGIIPWIKSHTLEPFYMARPKAIKNSLKPTNKAGNMWAVLIGASKYSEKSGFDSLDYVQNDIRTMKISLKENIKNLTNERVYIIGGPNVIENDGCNYIGEASKHNIEAFLGDILPNRIKEEDQLIIFFSGHGYTRPTKDKRINQGFLIPLDGQKDKLFSTCISMDTIKQISESIKAKQILFIIDTCNSGLALLRSKGYEDKRCQETRQAMTAAKPNQLSQVSSKFGQSVYTYYLAKGLTGKADTNKDGIITIHELHLYVRTNVTVETGNKQIPQMGRLNNSNKDDFFFILKTT